MDDKMIWNFHAILTAEEKKELERAKEKLGVDNWRQFLVEVSKRVNNGF